MRCLHFLPSPPQLLQLPVPKSLGASDDHGPVRILAAVDHEDFKVMELAAQLARSFQATLAVIFVINDLSAAGPHTSYSNADVVADRREHGRQILKCLAEHYPATKTILREGSAAVQVVAAARDWGASLIVMGTHCRGAFGRFFLGSTSFDILQQGTCPVLLVPEGAPEPRSHTAGFPSSALSEINHANLVSHS